MGSLNLTNLTKLYMFLINIKPSFSFLCLSDANPEPAPAPTVASPAKASVSCGHPHLLLSLVYISAVSMAQPEAGVIMQDLELWTWRLYRFLPCLTHPLSAVYQRETCPPVNTYTHSKSQFKGQLLCGAFLRTIPFPFLVFLAH